VPETLIVPLDGSPLAARALDPARPLAARLGAEVVIVGCAWSVNRQRTEEYLEGLAGDAGGVTVTSRLIEDQPPPAAILQAVRERPGSCLCMTTHGRGRLRWALVGSVAEQVIRDSPDPLLLVGPRAGPRWDESARRMVVCVDGSDAGPPTVDAAATWARVLDLELRLVFVSHPLDVPDAVHPETVLGPLAERVRAAGLPVHTEAVRSSYVAGTLVDVAESPPATMLVMAARGRAGIARAALGSVTMGVVNIAPCPVLVVPPGRVVR
jgi:nucleotide-binding universal stress UspA family protein